MEKVKTVPMNSVWLDSLRKSGLTPDSVYRGYDAEPLKSKLFAVGGEAVILEAKSNYRNYKKLVKEGEFISGAGAKMWKLREGHCHENVEYIITRYPRFKGFMGFALSEDGVWRYHSWAFDPQKNCIRETTEPRLMYYGIPIKF